MLRGVDANRIIVGAYVDPRSGGVCPMLAAHRNGGRTSVASFARAWDAYTGAKRPRRATRREVRTLRTMLVESLDLDPVLERTSIAELAAQIRAEREQLARCEPTAAPPADEPIEGPTDRPRPAPTGERNRAGELRHRPHWSWLRPTRRLDEFKDLLAAAEEELSERRAAELIDAPERSARTEPE
jgi:hypothetical protein